MEDVNLLLTCLNAFIAVLVLLSALAVGMRILTTVFPVKVETDDSAIIAAAITSAVTSFAPGARVSKITEEKGGFAS